MDGTIENMRDVHRFSKVSELICFDASCDMVLAVASSPSNGPKLSPTVRTRKG